MRLFHLVLILLGIYVLLQVIVTGFYIYKSRSLIHKTHTGSFTLGSSKNPPFSIFLDGDSIGAGIGATSFKTSLAGRIGQYYASKYHVTLQNNATSGTKTKGMINRVTPNKHFDLIVLVVSANDLFTFTNLADFQKSAQIVLDKYSTKADRVIVIGPARIFDARAIPLPLRPIYWLQGKKYGKILDDLSLKYPNVTRVNPQTLHQDYAGYDDTNAMDGFHPNDEGHRLWFDLLKPFL